MTNQKHDGQWDQEIETLAARVAELERRKDGGLVQAPAEVRAQAVSLWRRTGMLPAIFSERIGISPSSLGNWGKLFEGKGKRGKHKAAARSCRGRRKSRPKQGSTFKQVEVVAEAPDSGHSRALVLELGNGARVSGLSLSDVARLLGSVDRGGR